MAPVDVAGIARRRMVGLGLWRPEADEGDVGAVARRLVAVQAQEHPYARWALAQRTAGTTTAAAVDAAFDAEEVLRTHVLRPTWHYVAPDDAAWLMTFSGPRVHAGNSRRYRELELDHATLAKSARVIERAVTVEPLTRHELAAVLEDAGITTTGQRMPYLLMHAELRSVCISGPMKGKQHTYAVFADRVPDRPGPTGDDASAELARRYFSTRGPATVRDFGWWAGLKAADARAGLERAQRDLTATEVEGRTYWGPQPRRARALASPTVDLVQRYDEVIISYSDSRQVLHTGPVSFPVPATDALPHVTLLDGRLLGHWRRRGAADVEVRSELALDEQQEQAMAVAVDRYRRFLSG